jgi:hypothetical protein
MKVFIGGSRAAAALPKEAGNRLRTIVNQEVTVLVGDAAGIDTAVQQFFAYGDYRNVKVYAGNGEARNNIGGLPVHAVKVPDGVKGFLFYAQKDIAMAKDADSGFMIWNGKSRGTLHNIVNLTSTGKKTLIYLLPDDKLYCIDSLESAKKIADARGEKTGRLFDDLSAAAAGASGGK